MTVLNFVNLHFFASGFFSEVLERFDEFVRVCGFTRIETEKECYIKR